MKVFLLLFISSLSLANQVLLFTEGGRPKMRYDHLVKDISPGVTVLYPDQSEFKILSKLEGGGTNRIFRARLLSTGEEGILRVPREQAALPFATATLRGYPLLNRENVPTPKLIKGKEGQYVFQQEVPVQVTALKLLEGKVGKATLPLEVLFERLVMFFEKTARFRRMDDLTPENVAFDGEKWIALDWQASHALIEPGKTRTLLDSWAADKNSKPLVQKFWKDAKKAVEKTRQQNPIWLEPNCKDPLSSTAQ